MLSQCRVSLLLLLTLAVLVYVVEPRHLTRRNALAAKIAQRRMGDIEFLQQIFNRTVEGDMEEAFSMVVARVSDDLSNTMSKITDFLEEVRRNITMNANKAAKKESAESSEEAPK
ncbi:uncharacterized protein LOC121838541 [Ixodes scapularis]|uniref:uncharacterized protein LOC121838541 n=1 Tax=Ixodes scapularis TaxID=6945 RepID=UPI001C384EFA|nr:uncharacterized protein LOC121838541 [Ixodes scapularis]